MWCWGGEYTITANQMVSHIFFHADVAEEGDSLQEAIALSLQQNTKLATEQPQWPPPAEDSDSEVGVASLGRQVWRSLGRAHVSDKRGGGEESVLHLWCISIIIMKLDELSMSWNESQNL